MPVSQTVPSTPATEAPPLARSSTAGSGFFHGLHVPKPLRPLTAFSRTASSASVSNLLHRNDSDNHHPSPSALSAALANHAARGDNGGRLERGQSFADVVHTHPVMSNGPEGNNSATGLSATSPLSSSPAATNAFLTSTGPSQPPHHLHSNGHSGHHTPHSGSHSGNHSSHHSGHHSGLHSGQGSGHHSPHHSHHHAPVPDDVDLLSQVPSYDIAARGFLGGGVVPIERALPSYDDIPGATGTNGGVPISLDTPTERPNPLETSS